MPKHLISALTAGLLASGLFLLVFGLGLGFIFMFLPALPLLFLGLSRHAQSAHISVAVATLLIMIPAGFAAGMVFLLFLGLPAWFFAHYALHARSDGTWFPIGIIMMYLSLYASSLVAMATWYYADAPGGLPGLLSGSIHQAFAELEIEYSDAIANMADAWSFAMFPITIWMWGMLVYAHAWLANRGLARKQENIRPDMQIMPFVPPSWLLSLLAIAALASLIGSPSMAFVAKSTLLSLLLPYFFLGCALVHQKAKAWPSARVIIFFFYFSLLTLFWPGLFVAVMGVFYQIKCLSGSGSWFKS